MYRNPAITPGEGSDEEEPTEEDTEQSHGDPNALQIMLSDLVSIEGKRAIEASAKSGDFCSWMDSFYTKWELKLADKIEVLGGDRDLATRHCKESKRLLIACADTSESLPQLTEKVESCVANWVTRSKSLAEEVKLAHV